MQPQIYKFVFLALKKELEEQGYRVEDIEKLQKNYSWFLSKYSLLRVLLKSKLPVNKCQRNLDFLIRRHMILASKIRSKSTVLDIGCGVGILVCLLAKKGCKVYGVDIDGDNLRVARRLSRMLDVHKLCVFHKTEANTLPFNESVFDYAVLSWTLHDIKVEDRDLLLSECLRVLKSKGKLLILDPENALDFDQLQDLMSRKKVKMMQRKTLSVVYSHGELSNATLVVYQKRN
jgi:ubiquinone/menaquinone biosynthesis C-methylase UbiE